MKSQPLRFVIANPQVQKDLDKNKIPAEQIYGKLDHLCQSPQVALDPQYRLKYKTGFYKVRVGSYRIIYTFDSQQQILVVTNIDLRNQVYKK